MRLLVYHDDVGIYAGIIAILFTAIGSWLTHEIYRPSHRVSATSSAPVPVAFVPDPARLSRLAISKRELEVLELIALGLSNQEIADRMFVSPNTVKTHLSRVFEKLEVNRRVQAIQKARSLQIIA